VELELLNFSTTESFRDVCNKKMPTSMKPHEQFSCAALICVLSNIHKKWVLEALVKTNLPQQTQANMSNTCIVDEVSEVNNFLGWAIANLLQKWRRKNDQGKDTKTKYLQLKL